MKVIKLILIYFGFQILFVLLFMAGYYLFTGSLEESSHTATMWGMAISSIVLCVYLYWKKEMGTDQRIWSIAQWGKMIPIVLGFNFAVVFFSEIFQKFIPLPDFMQDTFMAFSNNWVGVIGIAIAGPIAEEFLFRGAIMGYLMKVTSPTKAILYSSLIFGIIHLNPAQIVFAFGMGLLLGWVFYKTGSLIWPIMMHVVNNSISTFLSVRYPDVEYISDTVSTPVYFILVILACVIFTICFIALKKQKEKFTEF